MCNDGLNKKAGIVHSYVSKRAFRRDFISGEMNYFQFYFWGISYNCSHEVPWIEKRIAGVIPLRSFWQKWNFISGDDNCYVNSTPKWNHPKENIWACKYFIKTKIVDQKFKTKVNFISFRPKWKLMFLSRRNVVLIDFYTWKNAI